MVQDPTSIMLLKLRVTRLERVLTELLEAMEESLGSGERTALCQRLDRAREELTTPLYDTPLEEGT